MEEFKEFAERLKAIGRQAYHEYRPIVYLFIASQSTDQNEIDHILDRLLDFCFDADCLLLFKKMCRYYWLLDQAATASYIQAYRQMWDSEDEELDEEKNDEP